jgi:hypothetical protein
LKYILIRNWLPHNIRSDTLRSQFYVICSSSILAKGIHDSKSI